MRLSYSLALTGIAVAAPATVTTAATIDLTVTIPQLKVAEYHKPYVAIFVEQPGGTVAPKTLAVWYDLGKRNNAGTKWVNEMRTWWRKGGRTMKLPADGISGATHAPGPAKVTLNTGDLPVGKYDLVVEASREGGGREVVRLPINLAGGTAKAAGTNELGAVTAVVKK
ncbi:DUF2271 domain-containing protein [Sphingomonas montanisoli]|uniref:DUF2271 domain-containing protein n=1 Tax=Sphingomonas montanisoli TaxID=2606412 RepID=A0A5D9C962_9SPHN|nr:DUF2271 domain-containing protein [Sphingomonas montanisoli]TZG27807.1 DUF2271 domain-containing protein [Sphingomonas montanisoli]